MHRNAVCPFGRNQIRLLYPTEDRIFHKEYLLIFLRYFDRSRTSGNQLFRSPNILEEKADQARSKLIDKLCMTSLSNLPLKIKAADNFYLLFF